MILNMIGGGGLGTELNFKVVGGTTEPSSPRENTIWVNTSTSITSWVFSADEPVLRSSNKNMFVVDASTITESGVTFTVNSDKSVSIKGTSTAEILMPLNSRPFNDLLEFGETYTFKGTGNSNIYIGMAEVTSSMEYVKTYTMSYNNNSFVYNGVSAPGNILMAGLYIPTGKTINSSVTIYPQLEKGSSSTEYIQGNATGMVWIPTGTSSTAEFNALKKNGITIRPIGAKQYSGGTWLDKNVKVCRCGQWVEAKHAYLYLYKSGAVTTDAGSIVSDNGKNALSEDGTMLHVYSTGNNVWGHIYFTKKINLTGYNTLYMVGSMSATSIGEYLGEIQFGAFETLSSSAAAKIEGTKTQGKYTVDISGLSGEYYISFYLKGFDKCATADVSEIWLE